MHTTRVSIESRNRNLASEKGMRLVDAENEAATPRLNPRNEAETFFERRFAETAGGRGAESGGQTH